MDPLQFFKTLRTEDTARTRLGDIVTVNLRGEVARNSSSGIIDGEPVLDAYGVPAIDEDGLPMLKASESRTDLLENVLKATRDRVEEGRFGVEVIDITIQAR